ncbi:MAG TPA: glycosyltransferase family 2 protein [Stellaceae bacterium]|nr:glycosyltransferase family 2 protein [Stellaceae bacterium]
MTHHIDDAGETLTAELLAIHPDARDLIYTAADATRRTALIGGPELSVIVPIRNEALNIRPLVEALHRALTFIDWEVIFVDDDSADGTIPLLRRVGAEDHRVRLLHRIGRRGLSSACIEGIQASTAPYVAIMDGDMQHDEALLPRMLETLMTEPFDVVVGSRYVAGGGVGDWDSTRVGISNVATRLSRLVLHTPITDPMSGFFMMRREAFDGAVRRLSAISFKILVDVLVSSAVPLRVKELPYEFRQRHAGESKLDSQVVVEYLLLLADKMIGRFIPIRFLLFSIVGTIGLFAHLTVLWLCLGLIGLPFIAAQSLATGIAMIGNFTLNNLFTYRDRRLKGWKFLRGLASFAAVCSFGAVANIGIATFLYGTPNTGWLLAGIAGAAMNSVWNYAVSSVVTWKRT